MKDVKNRIPAKITRTRYVFAALFAALIAVSSFLVIPLPVGIVPIVLTNLFVVLSGLVLGGLYGGLATLIFLTAGLLGFPVLVIPGPGAFLTNLGGYLIGYLLGSLCAGLICGLPSISEKSVSRGRLLRVCAAAFAGFAIILLCGAFYIMLLNSISFHSALLIGVVPFLIGDALKLAAAVPVALKLRPIAARYINPDA
ncbi:MAG: biotin transporter BioY [Spirochaetes bacterium]|nr:biotin transporter BioY [Spirochaetota bacterium]